MSVQDLTGSTAIVTGASRGFGRGAAVALAHAGAHVIGVARDRAQPQKVQSQPGEMFIGVVADAADQVVVGQLIDSDLPRALVLNAGANPLARPIHLHTSDTFSRNWHVDVQHVFNWTRFIGSYGATESESRNLGIEFIAVLPRLTPATDLGAAAIRAYAARHGLERASALKESS